MSFRSADGDPAWNGSPAVIDRQQTLSVPECPNGSTIFTAMNVCAEGHAGALAIYSRAAQQTIDVPFDADALSPLIQNWQGDGVNVVNISGSRTAPTRCQLIGRGMPGVTPIPLPTGRSIQLAPGQVAQGTAQPQSMQLIIQSTNAMLGFLGLIGGPVTDGNNGYIFAVNYSRNITPPGYTQVTTADTLTYQFNWGSSTVFIGKLSYEQPLTITLRSS